MRVGWKLKEVQGAIGRLALTWNSQLGAVLSEECPALPDGLSPRLDIPETHARGTLPANPSKYVAGQAHVT